MGREDFLLPTQRYLLSHSVGLALRSSQQHWQEAFFQHWQENPEQAWPNWLESIDGFRTALGQLLNGDAEDFCPQSNLSSGFSKILQAVPPPPTRNIILLSEEDFPSMSFVAQQATAFGWQLRFLPDTMDLQDLEQWKKQLSDDVGLVLLTHVYSNSSLRLPITELLACCRQNDILSVVDIAQSIGVVPIDLQDWQADFVLGSCVKWLCGGPGAGFMWVKPEKLSLCQPKDVGWFSHQNPFEFDVHNFRYHDSALRFWGGTPSVQPYALAKHSVEYFQRFGVENCWKHNQMLTEQLRNAAGNACITPRQRGGTVVLKFQEQEQFVKALSEAGIQFDQRPSGVRVSPHIYNEQSDVDALIACYPDH
ncbi:aminotransferase class V-fold PLP-dependent enzyme [Pseudoteredinibacter isoporae]|uniref:aminotransferase class V-fold PLP-dependent enzyme n=1 Tax=Pseudoteredinibacter isoporae TaxID=570281 RepID=UPI00310A7ABA